MKRALVCGAGGFIGSHLVKRLKADGYWVVGADMKEPEFAPSAADEFLVLDLRDPSACRRALMQDGSPGISLSRYAVSAFKTNAASHARDGVRNESDTHGADIWIWGIKKLAFS